MVEGKWHKKVRKELVEKYDKEGYKVESSHEDKVIGLYRGKPSRKTFLSDADIIIFKDNGVVKIVEVKDGDIRPKDMVGIIKTTDICNLCKIDGLKYDLSNVELLIVYPKQKDKSKKPEQLQLIKDNLKVDGCLIDYHFREMEDC